MSDPMMQFLNSVLSQRGPQALPYVEDDKWSVREHILLLVQAFPGLKVRSISLLLFPELNVLFFLCTQRDVQVKLCGMNPPPRLLALRVASIIRMDIL